MPDLQYEHGVFINCPIDDPYLPLMQAVVFTVYDCHNPSSEPSDGLEVLSE